MKPMSESAKKTLNIVNVIVLILAVAAEIWTVITATGANLIVSIVELYVLFSAAFYWLYGYKKDTAKFYNLFIYAYAIVILFRVYTSAGFGSVPSAICATIAFGGTCILAVSKDLGKKKTLTIGFIVLVAMAVILVRGIVRGALLGATIGRAAETVDAILLNLMILAKYEDKAERGTT